MRWPRLLLVFLAIVLLVVFVFWLFSPDTDPVLETAPVEEPIVNPLPTPSPLPNSDDVGPLPPSGGPDLPFL